MLAFAALALASFASAAPVAVLAVEKALDLPTTTQTNKAVYYNQNGNAGACGLYSQDADLVVGLPWEFYNQTGVVSSYCGTYLVVKSVQNNLTVTARVADASATNETLSLSVGTWNALKGTDSPSLQTVQWRFANQTETAAAKKALGDSSAAQTTNAVVAAPSTTSAAPAAAATTSSSAAPYVAPSSSSAAPYVAPSSSSTAAPYVAPTTTSVYVAPTTTTTSAWVAPTTTTTTSAWVAPTTTQAAATANQKSTSSASSGSYSGTATYFYQGGNPGNCGTVHSDSDYIVALTSSMYSGGSHCGQGVKICSTSTGRCTTASVADSCPSCTSTGDLDLSVAAFNAIASASDGVSSITWSWA